MVTFWFQVCEGACFAHGWRNFDHLGWHFHLTASSGRLMFQLLRNCPELFVNQRVLHRPPLCHVYFFTWYPDEGLTIWLFLDETDRSQVAISCFACYICHYDVIQELAAPSVSSDE